MEPLISSWSAIFLQHGIAAAKLYRADNPDPAERDLVGEMVRAAGDGYHLAEETLFIQQVLSVLDDSAQKAVTPIVQARLAKMFKTSCDSFLKLEVIIARGDAPRLQEAQALFDQGEAFTKKLGESVTNTRS